MPGPSTTAELDVVIVGAGFAGLYSLYRCRQLGLRAQVFERGAGIGGTWFWNRYPGARCDIESLYYSYSFSKELEREWNWGSRYAPQPEILDYIHHVADRFDLRRDIQLETSVQSAVFDERSATWTVTTSRGTVSTRFLVTAVGCLSAAQPPKIPGIQRFAGETHHTGNWPQDGVDFAGKRVGVIGTGSSGIQLAPIVAEQAAQLHVFQRTPQYSVPARNGPMDPARMAAAKASYGKIRESMAESFVFVPFTPRAVGAADDSPENRQRVFDEAWESGGYMILTSYPDLLFNEDSNRLLGEYAWQQIASRIDDPEVARKLKPDYPFGAKRLCADSEYFEMFNRDNVTLVDLRESAIKEITGQGIRLEDGRTIALDVIIFATGFDAMTGALLSMDIRGRGGQTLRQAWSKGTRNYLGVGVSGFPNLFTVTGPGSPSVLVNMVPGIEQHVDWITGCIAWVVREGHDFIEADAEDERRWTAKVDEIAAQTLYPRAKSWYMGSNTPGKVEGFMPFAGGGQVYRELVEEVAGAGYRGFTKGRVGAKQRSAA